MYFIKKKIKFNFNFNFYMTEEENEIPSDLKNDIQLAFDLFKNEKDKISKLKLRTLLFSFVMYKNSADDINNYIESQINPEKNEFSFDEVCDLVNLKLKNSKLKESDEIFSYITSWKNDNDNIKCNDLLQAYRNYEIDVSEDDIKEMMIYMNEDNYQKNKKLNDIAEIDENEDENENENIQENKELSKEIPSKISKSQFRKFYTNLK